MEQFEVDNINAGIESSCAVICPYLGTVQDPHTSLAYPAMANYCHRNKLQPGEVSLSQQSSYCLSEKYDTCATFRDASIPLASVDIAHGRINKRRGKNRRLIGFFAVVALFTMIFGAAIFFGPELETEPADVAAQTVSLEPDPPAAVVDDFELTPMLKVIAEDEIAVVTAVSDNTLPVTPEIEPTPTKRPQKTATPASHPDANKVDTIETQQLVQPPTVERPTLVPTIELAAPAVEPEATEPAPLVLDIGQGTAVVNTGALNVRLGPGPQYPPITRAHNGEQIWLLGRNGDNSWVKVRLYNGVEGWVYTEYLQVGQSLAELPFIPRAQRIVNQ